jgi:hypothetical protein
MSLGLIYGEERPGRGSNVWFEFEMLQGGSWKGMEVATELLPAKSKDKTKRTNKIKTKINNNNKKERK